MKKLVLSIISLMLLCSIFVGCANNSNKDTPQIGENNKNEEYKDQTTTPENPDQPYVPDGPNNPGDQENNVDPGHPEDPTDPENPSEPDPLPKVGTEVGDRFADLTLTTLSGEEINTADLRGKIVVFNVWATWCPPCKAELPDFNIIASEYADDVVIIAAHSYDSGMYSMPDYVESNFKDTKIIFAYDTADSKGYQAAGGIGYVPQTAIFDQDGIILYSDSGMLEYDTLVDIINANLDKNSEAESPTDPVEPDPLPEVGTKVGDRFADLSLTTLSGEEINTADLRGKIIVFNVWATWCPPCKAELPDFNIIASEYADDVVIIAAHLYDNYASNMPSYVATNFPDTKIIFAYDYNDQGYLAAGGIGYVPQTAIIDQNGVIIYSDSGALTYDFLVEIIEKNK